MRLSEGRLSTESVKRPTTKITKRKSNNADKRHLENMEWVGLSNAAKFSTSENMHQTIILRLSYKSDMGKRFRIPRNSVFGFPHYAENSRNGKSNWKVTESRGKWQSFCLPISAINPLEERSSPTGPTCRI